MPITLPTTIKKPKTEILDFNWFFAGVKKIGKTGFLAQWPGHFIAECEVGNADHLVRNSVDIRNWGEFLETITLLEQNPDYCKVFAIDDVPSLYDYCRVHVRRLLKLEDNEPEGFDGWRTIRNKFTATMDRVFSLKCGKIFTAHTEINSVADVRGKEISKLETTMSKQCNEVMDARMTFWGVMERDTLGNRIIILEGNSFIKAGHGFSDHFLWQGKRIRELPMGESAKEAYGNFVKAFNNQLEVKPEQLYSPKQEMPRVTGTQQPIKKS